MKVLVFFTAVIAVIKCNYYYIETDCNPGLPCTSLDDLPEEINSFHFLEFSSGTHVLQRHILVRGVDSFIMVGSDSTIVCNGTLDYWLDFHYIHTINVSGLTFINCSGITYYSIFDLVIRDTTYAGCRSSECLFIESSNAIIYNVLFDNTIVGYNLVVTYSAAVLFNVTMTNSNCYFSLLYCHFSVIDLYYFYSSNVSGLILDIYNGFLFIEGLHTSLYDHYLTHCELLNSISSVVNISNSTVFTDCNTRTLFVNHSTLLIHDSIFTGKLEGYEVEPELGQKYGTALEANVSNIIVMNTTFQYFSGENGGAIEVKHNSYLITNGSFFFHNSARLGGAVKIDNSLLKAYDTVFLENEARAYGGAINSYNSTLMLKNCSLIRNTAIYLSGGGVYAWKDGLLYLNKTLFLSNSAPYGGALAIYQNTTLETADTTFDGNTGQAGGPIFIEDNCTFRSFSNLIIHNNLGGVMFIAQSFVYFKGNQLFQNNIGSMTLSGCVVNIEGTTKISGNSHYVHNNSLQIPRYVTHSHTAISMYTSAVTFNGQLSIIDNFMGGIGCIESTLKFLGAVTLSSNSAVPGNADRETSRGGGVAAYQCFMNYHGNICMSNNSAVYGGGMYASTSICNFYSSQTSFYFNLATKGGAIYMDLNSKLIFYHQKNDNEEPELKFTGNKATDVGGAMFTSDRDYFGVCNYNNNSTATPEHECFIQYVNLDTTADKIIAFKNNRAIVGSNIYGGLLNRCYVTGNQYSNGIVLFKSMSSFNESTSIASAPTQLCICHNTSVNCTISKIMLNVFKGETITLNVTAVDQIGTSLPAKVFSNLTSPESSSVGTVKPGQLLQTLPDHCSPLKYNIYSSGAANQIKLYPEGPCINKGISILTVELNFKPCPPGFEERNGSCQCHESLYDSTCDIDSQTITKHRSYWITYIATDNTSDLLVYAHCPYDYCLPPGNHVTTSQLQEEDGTDAQCSHYRSGTLCGGCKKGLSAIFGSSRCMKCSNITVLVLLPVALVGFLAVVAMLIFNLTVEVAVFNGIILFANIVAINYNAFFPAYLPTYHLTDVIGWINLDLGLETCFFDGLDMYGKVWLEILFPTYLLLLAAILLIMRHRINAYWMVKLFREKNPNAVVATILLLAFNKFLVLLPTLFSYAKANRESHMVWVADGNIAYGSGKHIALLVVGVALSTYVVLFTVAMVCGRSLIDTSNRSVNSILNKTHLGPILETYHAPYASSKLWPGILILYRVLIMLMSASTTPGLHHKLNMALLSIATLVTTALKDIMGVRYHNRKSAILDSTYLAAAGFLTVSLLYIKTDQNKAIASLTTTSAITLWTIVVISYHIYTTIGRIPVSRLLTTCHINRRQESSSELPAEANNPPNSSSDIITANTNITRSFIDTINTSSNL